MNASTAPLPPPTARVSAAPVIQVRSATASGRVRLHIPLLRRSMNACAWLTQRIAEHAAVTTARANHLTGSITVTWQAALATQHDIVHWIQQCVPHLPRSAESPAITSVVAVLPPRDERGTRTVPPAAAESTTRPWHALPIATLLRELESDLNRGLPATTAADRLQRYGPNALTETPPRPDWAIFADQFRSLPTALLGVSAAVALITGGALDAAVIAAVMLFNGGLGFITERQAERTIRSLGHYGPRVAPVLRDGRVIEQPVENLVPGDVLQLTPGTAVAADARVVTSHRLTIDEAALTGESVPTRKQTETLALNQPLADRTNMVYQGTHTTGGSGSAVVIATGMDTELGRIQALLGTADAPETPMQQQLDRLGRQLVIASGVICVGVFGLGLWRGYGFLPMLKSAISLAVAAVPEGLPTVATTTLALGIRNMRQQNTLMRQLPAVETLGSVQTLCFDKTGTLTLNRMTALAVATARGHYARNGNALLDGTGNAATDGERELLQRLLTVAALCNDTHVQHQSNGRLLDGSATESALVDLGLAYGLDVDAVRATMPRRHTHYRAEHRNYMVTLHEVESNPRRYVAVKGSPNEVLALCDGYVLDGHLVPLDPARRETLRAANDTLAAQALRVLAFADGWADDDAIPAGGLIWLGLIGMADPTRDGIAELMRTFHGAGITTVMITGDQSATAYAIAKQLNLNNGSPVEILDSEKLDAIDPEVLTALAPRVQVFSRVSPAHKLQIVRALQRSGRVVAMTGDGVNDSPALKAADIGIAMGNSGTDVARSVADVVLADDNLRTMATAVEQGRTIYSNIRKAVRFLLSTNLSEIEVMVATTALGLGAPLSPLQLLWINLLSDVFPGLALAVEPAEPDVMRRAPRDPKRPILDSGDLRRTLFEATTISAGALAAYFYGIRRYGPGPQASTISFMSLIVAELVQAYSCRSETHRFYDRPHLASNPYLHMAVGGSLALQLATPYIPPLRRLLGLAPLGVVDVVVVAAAAAIPFFANEFTKARSVHAAPTPTAPEAPA